MKTIIKNVLGFALAILFLGVVFWPCQVVEEERIVKFRSYPFRDDPVEIIDTDRRSYGYTYKAGDPWPVTFRGLKVGDTIQVKRYRNLCGYGIGLSAEPILPEQNGPASWWDKHR